MEKVKDRELKLAADQDLLTRKQQLLAVYQTLLERNKDLLELEKGVCEERKILGAVEERGQIMAIERGVYLPEVAPLLSCDAIPVPVCMSIWIAIYQAELAKIMMTINMT
ncbi:hypothetical protein HBH98_252060 [Parastagonospora nodorum]|nr:hypothetical protein HBH53_018140 [Parastagonospora nodorum]KAH3956304.1 hypothetical protein HBH51_245140 [Parastagonospora nodorum]KAH4215514.1 hypothetical protein HBI06_248630 [Parastagonospora nodorum]KAH4223064.1 hypothetical protein HBI05_251390 [Parastagonospora nodorum]KAH4332795.1 hypothetical protein HBH98_252060 [Parastagonospora nodorum]